MIISALKSNDPKDQRSPIHPDTLSALINTGAEIFFEKGKQEVFMRTVLNDEEGISKISTCKKLEKFNKES